MNKSVVTIACEFLDLVAFFFAKGDGSLIYVNRRSLELVGKDAAEADVIMDFLSKLSKSYPEGVTSDGRLMTSNAPRDAGFQFLKLPNRLAYEEVSHIMTQT